MTIVTINYADQDVEVIAGADAWTSGVSSSRRLNGHFYNATRANQDEIRWSRYFPKSGTYRVKVVHVTASNSGIVRLGINDVNGTKNTTNILNDDDWYSSSGIKNVESFATVEVSRGFNYINHLTNGKNGSSSHYYTYYQFVEFTLINEHPVLGEATASPRNGMELLASVELGSAANSLTTPIFVPKKFLFIKFNVPYSTGAANNYDLRVGTTTIDANTNYSFRYSINGATAAPVVNSNTLKTSWNVATGSEWAICNMSVVNISGKEKLFMFESNRNAVAGAGGTVNRYEMAGKWDITSNQIDIVQIWHQSAASNFGVGTKLQVWGMD